MINKLFIKKWMHLNFLQVFVCFCIPWYGIYFFITGLIFKNEMVLGKPLLYTVVGISLVFFIIGVFINYFITDTFSFRRGILALISLFILDQGIKVVVVHYQYTIIPLIDDWIAFKVVLNNENILNQYGIGIPKGVYFFIAVVPFILFRYGIFRKRNPYFVSIGSILLSAGILCSYTDKILYGGTYDYIYIKLFAVVDLKDIYISLGLCVLCQSLVYQQPLRSVLKELFTDPFDVKYLQYEYHNLKQWLFHQKGKKV